LPMRIRTLAAAGMLLGATLCLQACLAVGAGGAVIGATGAVVSGTAKGAGAVGRAVIPGDGRED